MMSAHRNLKSHVLLKDLEYLYEVLIKPIRDAMKTLHQEQKLVFIPCEVRLQFTINALWKTSPD